MVKTLLLAIINDIRGTPAINNQVACLPKEFYVHVIYDLVFIPLTVSTASDW